MQTPEETPKLRLAPAETPEELARRFERETRPVLLQRESRLENSLAGFKVGSVPYLNAVPLTRGLEEEIIFAPPSELACSWSNFATTGLPDKSENRTLCRVLSSSMQRPFL